MTEPAGPTDPGELRVAPLPRTFRHRLVEGAAVPVWAVLLASAVALVAGVALGLVQEGLDRDLVDAWQLDTLALSLVVVALGAGALAFAVGAVVSGFDELLVRRLLARVSSESPGRLPPIADRRRLDGERAGSIMGITGVLTLIVGGLFLVLTVTVLAGSVDTGGFIALAVAVVAIVLGAVLVSQASRVTAAGAVATQDALANLDDATVERVLDAEAARAAAFPLGLADGDDRLRVLGTARALRWMALLLAIGPLLGAVAALLAAVGAAEETGRPFGHVLAESGAAGLWGTLLVVLLVAAALLRLAELGIAAHDVGRIDAAARRTLGADAAIDAAVAAEHPSDEAIRRALRAPSALEGVAVLLAIAVALGLLGAVTIAATPVEATAPTAALRGPAGLVALVCLVVLATTPVLAATGTERADARRARIRLAWSPGDVDAPPDRPARPTAAGETAPDDTTGRDDTTGPAGATGAAGTTAPDDPADRRDPTAP